MEKEKVLINHENIEEANEQGLEELFADLEETIGGLEAPGVALEDAFALYEKGMRLLKECNAKIDDVEKKMLMYEASSDSFVVFEKGDES